MHRLGERLERAAALDAVASPIQRRVSSLLPPGTAKDLLSGTWLGHAAHPMLTDVPLGAWLSASVLDLLGGEETERASRLLMAFGLASAVPTAVTGMSDWSDTTERDRRVGIVHATANTVAASLYAAALAVRMRGRRRRGIVLGLAGGAAAMVGGWLGGHLSFGKGIGVDHTAFGPDTDTWTSVSTDGDLSEGRPSVVQVGSTRVLLVKRGSTFFALDDTCSHLGCSLASGEVGEETITCPCHGSVFRLDDGSVVRGPARSPQPVYRVRTGLQGLEVAPRDRP